MNTNTIALDALKAAYITMQHMGNVLNNMDGWKRARILRNEA